jgi:hypothetical protein
LVVIVSDGGVQRELTGLGQIAAFTREFGRQLTEASARRLGAAAAVLASLDPSVRWPDDVQSLGKLLDAYDFSPGVRDASRAFAAGVDEVLREVERLGQRPASDDVARLLGAE